MFPRILKRIKEKIRSRQYVMTVHAEEEMDDDELTVYDIECGILTGEIVERQKDRESGEWKYLIKGKTLNDIDVELATKLSITGKLVVITIFLE